MGHKKNDSPATLLSDDLHQIPKFYLFDKNFHTAHRHVSCTTKTNIKNEKMVTVISNLVFL